MRYYFKLFIQKVLMKVKSKKLQGHLIESIVAFKEKGNGSISNCTTSLLELKVIKSYDAISYIYVQLFE